MTPAEAWERRQDARRRAQDEATRAGVVVVLVRADGRHEKFYPTTLDWTKLGPLLQRDHGRIVEESWEYLARAELAEQRLRDAGLPTPTRGEVAAYRVERDALATVDPTVHRSKPHLASDE